MSVACAGDPCTVPRVSGRYVLRFSPFTVDGLRRTAQAQVDIDRNLGRKPQRWGISAFTGTPHGSESVDMMVIRVCHEVAAGGRRVAVVPEEELRASGFWVHDVPPPEGHVLIGDQGLTESADLPILSALWLSMRRPNPAYKKGSAA